MKWDVGFETTPGSVRLRAEAGHRYVVVSRQGLTTMAVAFDRPGA